MVNWRLVCWSDFLKPPSWTNQTDRQEDLVHGPPIGDSWPNKNALVSLCILEVTSRNVRESLEILLKCRF